MTSFLLTILCLNLDALSYGISYGIKKIKIPLKYILFIFSLSTFLFLIPLSISRYICKFFNPLVLRLINALILILLGIIYIIKNKKEEQEKKQVVLCYKSCFFECLAISTDAIFTAILSGFSGDFFIFSIFFYGLTCFFAIFFGNLIFYYFNKNLKINLSFFSGFIFIILGILKCVGI